MTKDDDAADDADEQHRPSTLADHGGSGQATLAGSTEAVDE